MEFNTEDRKNLQVFAFLLLITLSGIGVFFIFSPYLAAIFMGLVFALIFSPIYKYIDKKFKFKKTINTIIVFIIFLLLITLPTTFLTLLLISETPRIIELVNNGELLSLIKDFEKDIKLNLDIIIEGDSKISSFVENSLESVSNFISLTLSVLFAFVTNIIKSMLSSVIPFTVNTIIFAIAFIIFVPNISNIKIFVKRISPFKEKVSNLFINRVSMITKSMVLASLTVAIINAFIVGLVFLILGIPFAGLAAILTAFLGIIPLVGPSLIMLPTAVLLILNGYWFQAIVVLTVHFVILSNIEFLIKPYFVNEEAKMNPIILAIATIGGLSVFGLVGLIYGPLIVILFTTCIEVYLYHIEGKEFTDSQIYGNSKKNPIRILSFFKRKKKYT